MQHKYFEVDVFATAPFSGNPLGVITGADSLTTAQMQKIANWTNFSETTFLLEPHHPEADYRVRIFTPTEEFDFAGHPTLGSARVFSELTGKRSALVQECGVGLVHLREDNGVYSFATPPLRRDGALSPEELEETCRFLNITPADVVDSGWVDNGPGWRLIQLADAASVRALQPSPIPGVKVGVVGLEVPGSETAYEVRAFTSAFEDPVTGSFNGGAAQFLRGRGLVPNTYVAAQGSQLGRAGRVHIHDDGTDIWVGGAVAIRVRGTLES